MRKSMLLGVCVALVSAIGLSSCGDNDDTWGSRDQYLPNQAGLCKAWQLIGYGSEEDFHMIDEEYRQISGTFGYRFYLVFNSDGTFSGRESINSIFGKYTCTGSQIKIENLATTYIYDAKGNDESMAFLNHLRSAKSYGIRDYVQLRIYYSDTEFLYFRAIEMEELG